MTSAIQLQESLLSHVGSTANAQGRTRVLPVQSWPMVRDQWRSVAMQCTHTTTFLSAEVMDVWIQTVGRSLDAQLCLFEADGLTYACTLLVKSKSKVGPVPVTMVHLNCSGEPDEFSLCLEYNDLLCLPGYEEQAVAALLEQLQRSGCDFAELAGMSESQTCQRILQSLAAPALSNRQNAFVVDLHYFRAKSLDYAQSLSSNCRGAIRRSIKLYEAAYGPVQLASAKDAEEGVRWLEQLMELHQARWEARGERGAFGDPRARYMHRTMVSKLLPKGMVDIVRVTAGEQVIAVLYNFIHRGKVWSYQMGWNPEQDGRMRPGLTADFLTIEHYIRCGHDEYDFLAGDFQYKRSLATTRRALTWYTIPTGTLRSRSLTLARKIREVYRGRYKREFTPVAEVA